MPSPQPPFPKAAQLKQSRVYDPLNSVALGHQRAETRGPRGWRETRTRKLQSQLGAGNTGGERMRQQDGADDDTETAQQRKSQIKNKHKNDAEMLLLLEKTTRTMGGSAAGRQQQHAVDKEGQDPHTASSASSASSKPPLLFSGLVVYVNGSTHPLIGDHKLKKVLVEHGARLAIHLGRRQVTHIILGKPSGRGGGAGGGLAGGKLEKEIRRVGGCGVKYVGVEWVLESIKAGSRLPEVRFGNLKMASHRQPSVYSAFADR